MGRASMTRCLDIKQRVAVGAVLSAMALAVLDSGMSTVALPALATAFNASPGEAVLVVGAYQAAVLAGLLPSAHLADRFGHRRFFRGGILLFAVAGLASALAPSMLLSIIARAVQGLGAATIMALGIALIRSAIGDGRLPDAIAWNAMTVAICAAAGPVVGAALLATLGPQAIFAAGLPVAGLAWFGALAHGPDEQRIDRLDLKSIALHVTAVVLGLASIRLVVGRPAIAAILIGISALTIFALFNHSRTKSAPLFPSDLLGNRSLALQVGASVCCFVAQSAGLIALSFSLQSEVGHSVLSAGALLAAWPTSVALANFASRTRITSGRTSVACTTGALILAGGLSCAATLARQQSVFILAVAPILCGIGFGIFQLANNRALFLDTPANRSAAIGGLQGTARLLGQTLGTFLLGNLFATLSMRESAPAAFMIAAGFAILGAGFSHLAGRTKMASASAQIVGMAEQSS